MNTIRLTTPRALVLLAILCAGGILLLDQFYLQTSVKSQMLSSLRQEGIHVEQDVHAIFDAECDRLSSLATTLSNEADAAPHFFSEWVKETLQSADVDLAWSTDRKLSLGWSAAGELPALPAETVGRMTVLPNGRAVMLGRSADGRIVLGRYVSEAWLKNIERKTGYDVAFLPLDVKVEGRTIPCTAAYTLQLIPKDHLAVCWLIRGSDAASAGKICVIADVRQIIQQTEAARTTTLVILSLSIGVVLLAVLGVQILLTGPLSRLAGRLGKFSETTSPDDFTRDLHGEPLLLARQLQSALKDAAHRSAIDPKTHLATRAYFDQVFEKFYQQSRRYNRRLALLMARISPPPQADSDGDWLVRLAGIVEHSCRKADLPALWDEKTFAVLLPETSARDARVMADRIAAAVARDGEDAKLAIALADLNTGEISSAADMAELAVKSLNRSAPMSPDCIIYAYDQDDVRPMTGEGKHFEPFHSRLLKLDSQTKDRFCQEIESVVDMLERRDKYMAHHARKVERYAVLIARQMGLPKRTVDHLRLAALMHDVGMGALPDDLLLSPNPLNEKQQRQMRVHTLLSTQLMEEVEFLENAIPAVRYHHERFDGQGYPEGLAGRKIPLTARILAVADAFDAMTSPRAYREARTVAEAIDMLKADADTMFDPDVVEAFLAAAEQLGDRLIDNPPTA